MKQELNFSHFFSTKTNGIKTMENTLINRAIIKRIAIALGELNEKVIYVGGATVSLYINDPAADDVRPTKDVDITVKVASMLELENHDFEDITYILDNKETTFQAITNVSIVKVYFAYALLAYRKRSL